MEKLASQIEKILQTKLLLFQDLIEVFAEEKECIINMDIESLWVVIARKKELGGKILEAREEILSLLSENSIAINMENSSFSLTHIINILPVIQKTKSDLRKIKLSIDSTKDEIAKLAPENSRYVNEYMTVIDDIVGTIVETAKETEYNKAGAVQ